MTTSGMYLGVDAGGTRSTALVVTERGAVRGRADGQPANYQAIGGDAARTAIADVVNLALAEAGCTPAQITRACYGIAGADRPKDFAAIDQLLPELPTTEHRFLCNDTVLALRAGTRDGVGVAIVSGTGTNAYGRTNDGTMLRVGGFCETLGDFGAASDLGREAMRLAMRGRDGRGEPTGLYQALCKKLGVDPLEDIIDLWMAQDPLAEDLGALAPVVFQTAAGGDVVAQRLLASVGSEFALVARVILGQLFADGSEVPVVLGGSVLQRGVDPTIVNTVATELARTHPQVTVRRLAVEPVVGAVLFAHDTDLDRSGDGARDEFVEGLRAAYQPSFTTEVVAAK